MLVALVILGVVAVAAVVLWTADDTPAEVRELARVNPDLKVAADVGGRVIVSDRNGADPVFMRAADAGPYQAQWVSCPSVLASLPTWFQLPADAKPTACLEIAGNDGAMQVLNFTTGMGIPALWDEFYERLVSATGLDFHGGSASGPGRGTRQAPRSLSYAVDRPDGVDNGLSIDAFYQGDLTLAVITLRRGHP